MKRDSVSSVARAARRSIGVCVLCLLGAAPAHACLIADLPEEESMDALCSDELDLEEKAGSVLEPSDSKADLDVERTDAEAISWAVIDVKEMFSVDSK